MAGSGTLGAEGGLLACGRLARPRHCKPYNRSLALYRSTLWRLYESSWVEVQKLTRCLRRNGVRFVRVCTVPRA